MLRDKFILSSCQVTKCVKQSHPILQFVHPCRIGQHLFQFSHNPDESDVCDEQKNERKEPFENGAENIPVHAVVVLIIVQLSVCPTDSPELRDKNQVQLVS